MAKPTFGSEVRARRLELGLSQERLARRVDCSLSTIIRIERDGAMPKVDVAFRIAHALDLDLDDLVDLDRSA
jgi:transcriptional regulator with XRE-family HTH domain